MCCTKMTDEIVNLPPPDPIIPGHRGPKFIQLLNSILSRSNLKQDVIQTLLDEEGLRLYDLAFTHISANSENNLEYLEFLGDSIVNCCIVWYLSRRFEHLQGSKAVKIFARLKINLVSKKSFSELANSLDMWEYISAAESIRNTKRKKVLEDTFEAFFGCTAFLMDRKYINCSGYAVCYSIVESLFNDMDISLDYNNLFDARTRIKELFDAFKDIGQLIYISTKRPDGIFIIKCYLEKDEQTKILLGEGTATTKADATQQASQHAIYTLKRMGYERPVPEEYL